MARLSLDSRPLTPTRPLTQVSRTQATQDTITATPASLTRALRLQTITGTRNLFHERGSDADAAIRNIEFSDALAPVAPEKQSWYKKLWAWMKAHPVATAVGGAVGISVPVIDHSMREHSNAN